MHGPQQHLRHLVESAHDAATALSQGAGLGELLIFLDLLLRASAAPVALQEAAGVQAWLSTAAAGIETGRARAIALLGNGAPLLRVDARRAAFLTEADDEALGDSVVSWGEDVLMIAGMLAWLPSPLRQVGERVVRLAIDTAELYPERFGALVPLAQQRAALESLEDGAVQHLLELFAGLSLPPAEVQPSEALLSKLRAAIQRGSAPPPAPRQPSPRTARSPRRLPLRLEARSAHRLPARADDATPPAPLAAQWSSLPEVHDDLEITWIEVPTTADASLIHLRVVLNPATGLSLEDRGAVALWDEARGLPLEDVWVTHSQPSLWQAILPGGEAVLLEITDLDVAVVLGFERDHG